MFCLRFDTILILKTVSAGINRRKTRYFTQQNGRKTAENSLYKLELSEWE